MRPAPRIWRIAATLGALIACWQACTNDFEALGVIATGGAGGSDAGPGGPGPGGSSSSSTGMTGGIGGIGIGGDTATGSGGCGAETAECDSATSGCESLESVHHCGECGNDCTAGYPPGWVCVSATAGCGCAEDTDCGAMGSCDTRTGVCSCDGAACGPNEICEQDRSTSECVCGGGDECDPGFSCVQGICACDDDGACKHGGKCVRGLCHCTDDVCEVGEACEAADQCDS